MSSTLTTFYPLSSFFFLRAGTYVLFLVQRSVKFIVYEMLHFYKVLSFIRQNRIFESAIKSSFLEITCLFLHVHWITFNLVILHCLFNDNRSSFCPTTGLEKNPKEHGWESSWWNLRLLQRRFLGEPAISGSSFEPQIPSRLLSSSVIKSNLTWYVNNR